MMKRATCRGFWKMWMKSVSSCKSETEFCFGEVEWVERIDGSKLAPGLSDGFMTLKNKSVIEIKQKGY